MLPLIQRHQMVHNAQPRNDDYYYSSPPHSFLPEQQHHGPFLSLNHHIPFSNPPDSRLAGRPTPLPQRFSRPPAPLPLYTPPSSGPGPYHYLLPDHAEHRLRRKTPNGTIDAGYDGNPSHLASGPPPFKQMIMPTSSRPAAYPASLQPDLRSSVNLAPSTDRWMHPPSLSFHPPEAPGLLRLDTNATPSGTPQQAHPLQFATALALDCAPNGPLAAHQPYNSVPRVPTALQPVYQQSPGPAIFQNGGVLPPSAWPETNLASYAHAINPRASTYNNVYNSSPFQHYGSEGLGTLSSSLNPRPGYEPPHSGAVQVPSQKFENLTLESARYKVNEPHPREQPSPAQFRERVLAHGHRAYADLLTYLHQGKKSANRSSAAPRAVARMTIIPKLPKSASYPSSSFASHSPIEMDYSSMKGTNSSVNSQTDQHMASMTQSLNKYPFHKGEAHTPAFYFTRSQDALQSGRERVPVTPLTTARTFLGMLTQLCEQSDWKWVEGMLLGGCLHYGLEHYEKALEWFQRIVALDAK